MKHAIFLLIITILIFTVGCDYSKPRAKETKKEANDEIKGRKETVNLEAVGATGYDGRAVRKAVDEVLDKAKKRQKELDKIMR